MILTTKGRYAVMAMLELAKHEQNSSINLANISERQNIPLGYLEQICGRLRQAGIITSVRGPGGGYKLTLGADKTDIYSIISAVEEEISITRCGNKEQNHCMPNTVKCAAHDLWAGLEYKIIDYFKNITLSEVIGKTSSHIYLDYNATAPLLSEVREAMIEAMYMPANPSSVHYHGREAKSIIESARLSIAKALGVNLGRDYYITFTSSGTEANNLVLGSFNEKKTLVSAIEHLSVLESSKKNPQREIVEVDKDGKLDITSLEKKLEIMSAGSLLSVIFANNETGVVQDIKMITDLAHKYGVLVHSDCAQIFGKMPLNISDLGLDFATISAHKLGGPVGAGALVHRPNLNLTPQILGGGQEKGVRSGTENVIAIAGFGKAAELSERNIEKYGKLSNLRDEMENMIKVICPESIIFGKKVNRLPNTSMINMPGVEMQTQLIYFDLNNISVSGGAACSSGKIKNSHVLCAMGCTNEEASSAIRVSLGIDTKLEHIVKFVDVWKNLWEKSNIPSSPGQAQGSTPSHPEFISGSSVIEIPKQVQDDVYHKAEGSLK